MKIKVVILLLLVILPYILFSQDLKKEYELATLYYKAGDYKTANGIFQRIYDKTSNAEVGYYLAETYRMLRNYKKADRYYRKVLRIEKEKFPLAYYWEGMVKKRRGNYKVASRYFKKFYRKFKNYPDDFYLKTALYEKEVCERLMNNSYVSQDSLIKIKRMQPPVNEPYYSDYMAQEVNDSIFLFTSYRPVNDTDTISFTTKIFQICCGKLLPIDTILNPKGYHVPNFYYDSRDSLLLLTLCPDTDKHSCSIYQIKYYGGKRLDDKLQKLSSAINFPGSSSTQPCLIDIDGTKYLFFASNRAGGIGKYDIWYAKWQDGGFFDISNAGDKINSITDDICPFYDTLTSTLYFSSQWHESIGGFDVFSVYGNPGNWSEPINVGKPINSTYDDVFFSISKKSAYFSSNRPKEKGVVMCCNDIFSVLLSSNRDKLMEISRKNMVKNSLKQLIPIKLYFDNDQPNSHSMDTTTTLDYFYTYRQYLGRQNDFIKAYTQGLEGEEKNQAEEKIKDFFEDSVKANVDKFNHFMDLLENLLKQGDTIEITIKGFASPLNISQYNTNLSKRRIQSVVNYLYSYKNEVLKPYIDRKQLIIKRNAFGEQKASKNVSDKLTDLKHSVYSPEASKERKVEIIAIKF